VDTCKIKLLCRNSLYLLRYLFNLRLSFCAESSWTRNALLYLISNHALHLTFEMLSTSWCCNTSSRWWWVMSRPEDAGHAWLTKTIGINGQSRDDVYPCYTESAPAVFLLLSIARADSRDISLFSSRSSTTITYQSHFYLRAKSRLSRTPAIVTIKVYILRSDAILFFFRCLKNN